MPGATDSGLRAGPLGLCPIGKFVFSHADAIRQKQAVQARLRALGVPFVDLDGALPDGIVRDAAHVGAAVSHLRAAGVASLFLPHCNFGTEGAAATIARELGVPTLLWGPRDEAPLADGTRLRDSLCGLFATSKVLRTLGVPFSYIENCRIDDPAFAVGIQTFARAAHVAQSLRKGFRIGQIGGRIDFFWTTIVNEAELLQRFKIEILPFDMVDFIRHARSRAEKNQSAYLREVAGLRGECRVEGLDDAALVNILAVRDQMLALAEDHGLEALAVQDFTSLVDAMGAYCIHANGMVSERIAVAMETDIHGAVSAVLLRRAVQDAPVFMTEFTVRHPQDDNAVLLWHAGSPPSMKHPDAQIRLGAHWILPSPLSGMPHFRMKDGPLTLVRFDGDRGNYSVAVGEGKTTDGPFTLNNYLWMHVDNWPRWERTLIEGPYIHHVAMAYGNAADVVAEALRHVPGVDCVRLGSV